MGGFIDQFGVYRSLVAGAAIFVCFLLAGGVTAQESLFLRSAAERLHQELSDQPRPRPRFENVCSVERDPIASRVLLEYGSIFVADAGVRLPSRCIFVSGAEVDVFHSRLDIAAASFGTVVVELQRPAMSALLRAVEELKSEGLRVTPLDGRIAARRSFDDTVRIWNSRFHRGLDHWVRLGRITPDEAAAARSAPIPEQIRQVTAWESVGLFFSTDRTKSIFRSVAPPGTSQHLSLLAFDVVESRNSAVRRALNRHGWYQTILTDEPHFTFLGLPEGDLPARGLRNVVRGSGSYWVPVFDELPPRGRVSG